MPSGPRRAASEALATKRARVSFVVLFLYVLVGLLDSIAWRDAQLDADGQAITSSDGSIVLQARGLSLLDRLDAEGSQLRMFVDFHSTRDNVFYTITEETNPPGFSTEWLTRADARIGDDYPFSEKPGDPNNNKVVAKNYLFLRYGVPTATYEVGDESDRHATRKAAVVFAEELMQLMLEQPL